MDQEKATTPKIIEVRRDDQGHVIVFTVADGAIHAWTVTDDVILGGSVVFPVPEDVDHNVYRRQGDHWQSFTPEAGPQKVGDEVAAHLNLVEKAAAAYEKPDQISN